MTGCNEYKMLIQKFLDREISPGERARLERHISHCGDCEREFKAIQLGLDMLISMPVPEPGTNFTSDTVKKAFKAKKELARREKVMSWLLSSLIVIISLSIFTAGSMVFQPVLRWILLSAIKVLSQCSVLLTGLIKMVSAMSEILWTLGGIIYRIICSGYSPGFIYLTTLLVMIFFIFFARGRRQLFLLNRR